MADLQNKKKSMKARKSTTSKSVQSIDHYSQVGISRDSLGKGNTPFEILLKALDQLAIVAVTDKAGKITYVNDMFCQISGYGRGELIGSDHRILNSGFHPGEFFRDLWNTITSGRHWRGEIVNRRKDGTFYWVNTSIIQTDSAADGQPCYTSIQFDITAQKEAEAKLSNSAGLVSLGEMAGGLAHEINNPLAIIQAKAGQLIRRINMGISSKEFTVTELQKIVATSDRIAKIVKGLRTFSRNGEKDPFEKVQLGDLFENARALCGERFLSRGIKLEIGAFPDNNLECRGTQIEQVLVNLLQNAFHAVEKLSEKWVRIDFEESEEQVKISIIDSGSGIPTKVAEKLMQPFFTTKGVGGGTGLGLSISKGIIEEHHGRLYYDPSCSNTKFVIELPMRQPQKNQGAA